MAPRSNRARRLTALKVLLHEELGEDLGAVPAIALS